MLLNQSGSGGSPGLSAYQIAINNGFVGTEADWLASLEGENGHTPVKGVDYTDGAPSTIPGPSAYQIAVQEGFTGSESEWVASLEGDPGIPSTVPGPAGTTNYSELSNIPSTFPPSTHAHAPEDVTGTAVVTNDSRLSDARMPLIHAHSPGEITGTAVVTNDARLSDARTPLTHAHSYEPANANIQTHVGSAHAPSNAQKNSDITKEEIEAKLTGQIATHTHAGGGGSPTGIFFVDL